MARNSPFLSAILTLLFVLQFLVGTAQTNPQTASLPFVFNGGNNFPNTMAVHDFNLLNSVLPTSRTTSDGAGNLAQTSSSLVGGYKMEGTSGEDGISLASSLTIPAGAIIAEICTFGKENIKVTYTAWTVSNQLFSGNSIALQYRVGDTGVWINVDNPSSSVYAAESNIGRVAGAPFSQTLPAEANNKAVVQVRWIYWQSGGLNLVGDRIAIDDIAINGTNMISSAPQALPLFETAIGTTTQKTITISAPETVTMSISGTHGNQFSVSPGSLPGGNGTVTVNFNPVTLGMKYANLLISSPGAATLSIPLTGLPSMPVPTVSQPGNVGHQSFFTSWSSVAGAGRYYVSVFRSVPAQAANVKPVSWAFSNTNTPSQALPVNLERRFAANTTSNPTYMTRDGVNNSALTVSRWDSGVGSKYWQTNFSTLGMTNLKLSSVQWSTPNGPRNFKVQYSFNESTWIDLPNSTITVANNWTTGSLQNISMPAECNNRPIVYLRWVLTSNLAANNGTLDGTGFNAIDDVIITGDQTHAITPVPGSAFMVNSSQTSYTVSGLQPSSQYYYTVQAEQGTAISDIKDIKGVQTGAAPVTWNGSAWSNGTGPAAGVPAIIAGDYQETAGFECQNLTVNSGIKLTVNSFVKAVDIVNNGTIAVANNANFVQTGTFSAGPGSAFTLRRVSAPVKRLDYIAWSSPLATSTQTLKQFSYGQLDNGNQQSATGTLDNRFYTYNNGTYVPTPASGSFLPGRGFQIRTPNDHPATSAAPFQGLFTGTDPNSGPVVTDVSGVTGTYVFLGNPYPGSISAIEFRNANPGLGSQTLYVWDSAAPVVNNAYSGNLYFVKNPTGTVPFSADQYIAAGQGFFVERGSNQNIFNFSNSMRVADGTSGTFHKSSAGVNDKFWLQLSTPGGASPQILLAFSPDASAAYNPEYDARILGESTDVFYTKVGADKLMIDAHGAFQVHDAFQVSLYSAHIQNYTISMVNGEGLFSSGQPVYLRDKQTGTVTDLTLGSYSFTAAGTGEEDRFEVKFLNGSLGSSEASLPEILVTSQNGIVVVQSPWDLVKVSVYDMSGRLLVQKSGRSKTLRAEAGRQQMVLVIAELSDGSKVSRKIKL